MRRTRIIVHNSNRSDLNFKSGPPRFGRLPPNRLGGTPPPRNFSILTLVFIGRERRVALPGKSTTAMLSVIKIIDDCWRGSVLRDPQLCSHLPFDWWRLSTNWILVVLQIPDQKCFREAGAPRPTCQNQNILKMTKNQFRTCHTWYVIIQMWNDLELEKYLSSWRSSTSDECVWKTTWHYVPLSATCW